MTNGYDGLTGEYRANVDVRASVILGKDPTGRKYRVTMTGNVLIREWPFKGYERRTLPDGRVQLELEMVKSAIEGRIDELGEDVKITETTVARNVGTLTQVFPNRDFPAAFELLRLISMETPLGTLRNEQPILIHGILNTIPPIARSRSFSGFNIFEAVNTPVPMLNERNEIAAYFSGARKTRDNCLVRMVSSG